MDTQCNATCLKQFKKKKKKNKEQRFPAASNFNEFNAMTRNICLESLKVCKAYWKHI